VIVLLEESGNFVDSSVERQIYEQVVICVSKY
jgi:hypothetical protein